MISFKNNGIKLKYPDIPCGCLLMKSRSWMTLFFDDNRCLSRQDALSFDKTDVNYFSP